MCIAKPTLIRRESNRYVVAQNEKCNDTYYSDKLCDCLTNVSVRCISGEAAAASKKM